MHSVKIPYKIINYNLQPSLQSVSARKLNKYAFQKRTWIQIISVKLKIPLTVKHKDLSLFQKQKCIIVINKFKF